jgi:type I restriction enzyme S subunit
LENIVGDTGEYIPSEEKQSISSAGIFEKGQILFPKLRPYLNKVYHAEFDGICSTEFHIFDSPIYRNEFLAIYLRSNLIVSQTKHLMTGNTLPRLQTEDIRRLPVPRISLEKQDEIINIYRSADSHKKEKESEARKLFHRIGHYMATELGIDLPEKDTTLANRIYETSFRDLTGGRIDPEMDLYKKEVHKFKYETIELKKLIIKKPQYGATESGIARVDNLMPRYIRITDIDEGGGLTGDIGVTALNVEEKYVLNDNDILFARSGATVGKCYLHKSENVNYIAFFAGYMIRIVVDANRILPDFLFFYTQTEAYRRWVQAIQRAAGQPNINAEEYRSLPIPLPPITKQREIVQYINILRMQAIQLRQNAANILDHARNKIEFEILNGG